MQSFIEERHTRLAQQIDSVRDPLARNSKIEQLLSETIFKINRRQQSFAASQFAYDAFCRRLWNRLSDPDDLVRQRETAGRHRSFFIATGSLFMLGALAFWLQTGSCEPGSVQETAKALELIFLIILAVVFFIPAALVGGPSKKQIQSVYRAQAEINWLKTKVWLICGVNDRDMFAATPVDGFCCCKGWQVPGCFGIGFFPAKEQRLLIDFSRGSILYRTDCALAKNYGELLAQIAQDLRPLYSELFDRFCEMALLDTDLAYLQQYKAALSQSQMVKSCQPIGVPTATVAALVPMPASSVQPNPGLKLGWDSLVIDPALRVKLETYCTILKNHQGFQARGVSIPKGLLLYGPPGTGKTMIARVLSAQSGLAFIGCTTADIKQSFIGQSGQAVREIFRRARAAAPCLLFIDELEVLTEDHSATTSINPEIIGQLLQEIDGINADPSPVFVIGATNLPERIRGAILSRFTEQIEIPLPDFEQRIQLLDILIGRRPLEMPQHRQELLRVLAKLCDGKSGRDLRALIERATVHAIGRATKLGRPLEFSLSLDDLRIGLGESAPGTLAPEHALI